MTGAAAPLVEAEPGDRVLILVWTAVACVVAGAAYAVVRASQPRDDPDPT